MRPEEVVRAVLKDTDEQPIWHQASAYRFRRHDGAEVWRSNDLFYSNPENPRARLWEGSGPGPRDILHKRPRRDRVERFKTRRRFGSAGAAMKAVDSAFPLPSS